MGAKTDFTKAVESSIDLGPRRLPVQKRAKERVEHILDILAILLVEKGFDGISTNLIAERADVDVASIYQYFPNKYAILCALAERTFERNRSYVENYDSQIPADKDWTTAMGRLSPFLLDGMRGDPGNIAIRQAMRSRPEFCEIQKRGNELLAQSLADMMRKRGYPVDGERLLRMGRVMVETGMAILDVVFTDDVSDSDAYLHELRTLHMAYVKRCAEKSAATDLGLA
jgi:AcrR family transcriptional regulator